MSDWDRDEMREAAEALIAEGNENRVTSAILLGELIAFAANDWDSTWREWGEEVYDKLAEISHVYLRGA